LASASTSASSALVWAHAATDGSEPAGVHAGHGSVLSIAGSTIDVCAALTN
jgi:hypothetical protein